MAVNAPILVKNLDTHLCQGYSMPIPDSIMAAQRRIQTMIDSRYDGMVQKPEVLNDLYRILVVYTGNPGEIDEILANVQAAALDRSIVAH